MLLRRVSSRVPQGPFRHTKNPQQSGVCPGNRFVLDTLDKDVFPSLLPRKKWNEEKQNVGVDDFVLVQTPDAISGMLAE